MEGSDFEIEYVTKLMELGWNQKMVRFYDPECIHTVEEAIEYINEFGFLPLFKNEIPGFSLEERTVPEYWWCGDPKVDPWMWQRWREGL